MVVGSTRNQTEKGGRGSSLPPSREAGASGNAMVEFAVVLPVLMLLIFGVIQFALIFGARLALQNAAEVGARAATLASDPSIPVTAADAQVAAETEAFNAIPAFLKPLLGINPTISASVDSDGDLDCDVDDVKIVTINYDLDLILPFIVPGSSGGVMNMVVTGTMR